MGTEPPSETSADVRPARRSSDRLHLSGDDASVAQLFRRVWLARDLVALESFISPAGMFAWAACTYLIDERLPRARFMLRLLAPLFGALPVAAAICFKARRDQQRCVTAGLNGGLRYVAVFAARPGNAAWVSPSARPRGQDTVDGFLALRHNAILWLLVDAQARRRGVASRLLDAAEASVAGALDDAGAPLYSNVELECASTLPGAFQLYLGRGYAETKRSFPTAFNEFNVTFTKPIDRPRSPHRSPAMTVLNTVY